MNKLDKLSRALRLFFAGGSVQVGEFDGGYSVTIVSEVFDLYPQEERFKLVFEISKAVDVNKRDIQHIVLLDSQAAKHVGVSNLN